MSKIVISSNFACPQNPEMSTFQKEKRLRHARPAENGLEVTFCEYDTSKILKKELFPEKKAPAACPAGRK